MPDPHILLLPDIVLPCLLFPPRAWWQLALVQETVRINTGPPLRNVSYRNRYRIATGNGPLLLSVPLIGGRRHDAPLAELMTDEGQGWQRRHWRTLFSAYGRAPFFEYLGPELEALIMARDMSLAERNLSAIRWMARCMRRTLHIEAVAKVPEQSAGLYAGLAFGPLPELPPYRQVFDDRHGFIPDLSALDQLMMQGRGAGDL